MNLFEDVVTPFLEPRIKKGSIKAVKGYVEAVKVARETAIASFGLGVSAAILVVGCALMGIGIIGLLPISPTVAFILIFALGALLAGVSGFLVYQGFSEKVWIEKAKVNEMMEAAIKPWETPYSIPDPRKILKSKDDDSFDTNRKLKTSRANRTPAPTAYDTIDTHTPPATYASLLTPDAALVTRPIDTTDSLRP